MFRPTPLLLFAAALAGVVAAHPAFAETLSAALASAYTNNPTLNAARGTLRATDEGVPQALSGYRPTVTGTAQASYTRGAAGAPDAAARITVPCTAPDPNCNLTNKNGVFQTTGTKSIPNPNLGQSIVTQSESLPRNVSLSIVQPIFSGFRTVNGVKAAETAVSAGRQTLLAAEQTALLAAATDYMNLVRDRAIVGLNQQNVQFLTEQVKAAQNRLNVGEGTRTDVAQAQSALALAQSTLQLAIATVSNDEALYNQDIGHAPKDLIAAAPVDKMIPTTADAAVKIGLTKNPNVLVAQYNVDTADYNVKLAEGLLLPSATLTATLTHSDANGNNPKSYSDVGTLTGAVRIPLYDNGSTQSQVRQLKERLGTSRLQLDAARDNVRAVAVSGFGLLISARARVTAAEAGVQASQLALQGIQEQQRVGQSTTIDVLNAQQVLLNSRTTLVSAQRDRVVASYTLLSAIGGLTAKNLGLPVQIYDPAEHYDAVHDKWFGINTPDGR